MQTPCTFSLFLEKLKKLKIYKKECSYFAWAQHFWWVAKNDVGSSACNILLNYSLQQRIKKTFLQPFSVRFEMKNVAEKEAWSMSSTAFFKVQEYYRASSLLWIFIEFELVHTHSITQPLFPG